MKTPTPVNRHIAILTSNPRVLIPIEQFLSNRGWSVFTTMDEKAALTYLVDHRPSFFMVSVEHPNRKLRSLPRLLKQTYPDLCILMFAENNNMETYRLLTQNEHPYRVLAPVTGPAVERTVNRFLKDVHEKQVQEEIYAKSFRKKFPDNESLSWAPVKRNDNSVLSEGVGRVFEECVTKLDGVVREKIVGASTNAACIVIESERFSGYLVAAMAGDRPFDAVFIEMVRGRLIDFLRENGENVQEGESFPMKLREVKFENWALDYAEFLKKTVHEGHELALAFFPMAEIAPTVGGPAGEKMCAVRLSDIVADEVVDFNLYLFLPANQKLILFTSKGMTFETSRKERLVRGGVREMHVRSEDLKAFKHYRARHRLDALIMEFEERQRDISGF